MNKFLYLIIMTGCVSATTAAAQGLAKSGSGNRPLGSEFGFIIFQERCTSCHGNPAVEKAPTPALLREMTPERIYAALTSGAMQVHAQGLTKEQIARVAESMSGRLMGTEAKGDAASMPNQCKTNPPMADPDSGSRWNGWGGTPGNTRYRKPSEAGLQVKDLPRLKLKWVFGFDKGVSSFGQPALASGRVFVGSDTGYVYSLNAKSGCVYWSFKPISNVRNAINIGPVSGYPGTKYAAYFGDLKANVYALDAQTGKLLWSKRVEQHYTSRVTSAPALYQGRLYVPISSWEEASARTLDYPCCTFRGSVVAMDANTGAILWKTYTIPEQPKPVKKNSKGIQLWAPAGAAVWNTPVVDAKRHAIYFGTGDAYTYPAAPTSDAIMALDMDTGKNLWTYQVQANDAYLVGCQFDKTENCPEKVGVDWDIPAPPILQTMKNGQDVLIVCTKPGDVLSLNPDKQGALNWRVNVVKNKNNHGYSGMRWGGATDANNAYFGLISGGLVAIKLATGNTQWYSLLPKNGAKVSHDSAITLLGNAAIAGDMNGLVSAVSTADGKVLWHFNTNREFTTVNGVTAKGGSISGVGPVVSNGMLFVNSGYMIISGKPGNVLLAFGVGPR
jgi:polyvinyl alcohol dehydrogenase (cytochrome)